jgi:hypothetical protein
MERGVSTAGKPGGFKDLIFIVNGLHEIAGAAVLRQARLIEDD